MAVAAGRIGSIVAASRGVSAVVGEIDGATREQAAGIQQLNNTVSELESVTQTNATLADRTATLAHDLSQRAAALVAALERFSLGDDEGRIQSDATTQSPMLPADAHDAAPVLRLVATR
jgi:methyl-accepting chemotaxis protein